jgi:hypothetical protein
MPTLTVHLREGFFKIPVIVRINGEERFRSEALSTRMQTGLAKLLPVEVEAGNADVEIQLPSLDRTVRNDISVDADAHLGVDLDTDGEPTVRVQATPFMYA